MVNNFSTRIVHWSNWDKLQNDCISLQCPSQQLAVVKNVSLFLFIY